MKGGDCMNERIELKRGDLTVRVVPDSVPRFAELGWVEAPKAEPKPASKATPKRASRSRTKRGDGEE